MPKEAAAQAASLVPVKQMREVIDAALEQTLEWKAPASAATALGPIAPSAGVPDSRATRQLTIVG